ncbi:UNVERIFIED_CONTAM: lysine N(6)-hydroxylase/L-ornithine N(5)-oxygenase family protein [Halobacillus marinus]|uniref:lysine N(6)-hydroxylase/L-ornithine N(5)-oxygenase family protein n=1 Tax=Halobacillus sp. BAB-2008 TaxID=1246484 RepID=UPI0002A5040C|nr:lysine N(6)-hydroxylase/L-ornithine N(5)-oxygenase family protein [Halobacillus sp. BAB-2008]ELK46347.1 putative L-lysine 6-monooxygenase [Halobacillus sp. BAB-2008]
MEQQEPIYDLIGIGTGPFNLSLAALLDDIEEVDALFFEQKSAFEWHPGMLIEGTKMQVPFLADLVTMADPTNPYSFLNYISKHDRMYQFYFLQRLDIPRREYNDYCRWVADQLSSCRFGKRVTGIRHVKDNGDTFEVDVLDIETGNSALYRTRNLVMGTGSVPSMPQSFQGLPETDVFHTADFLINKDACLNKKSITVVGSGQSAAETFRDLLQEQRRYGFQLDWITRSPGFSSMEESKLSLEHFSPDYVNYFYSLPQEQKDEIFATQGLYYKGISNHTVNDIYNLLYEYSVGGEELPVGLQVLTEVRDVHAKADGGYELDCYHYQKGKKYTHETDVIIAATGYKPYVPDFVHYMEDFLVWDDQGRYEVTEDYRLKKNADTPNEIFVHSGISHTHGVGSTNLGLSIYRNKLIINQLTGREVFPLSEKNIFQSFSVQ